MKRTEYRYYGQNNDKLRTVIFPNPKKTMFLSIFFTFFQGCSTAPVEEPAVQAISPNLRRLTIQQYHNSLRDLFGESLVLPISLEPDTEVDGLLSIGSSINSVSPTGVERYEAAAFQIAEQVVADEALRSTMVDCNFESDQNTCYSVLARSFGSRIWRRSLTDSEAARITELMGSIYDDSGDIWTGVEFGLAAMLQSPHFLYRTEHGPQQLTATELASRLSFLLWNGPPDQVLLDKAIDSSLLEMSVLEEEFDRMIGDSKSNRGIRHLFSEVFSLHNLDSLTKDPLVFTHSSAELGPAAKEETLLLLENLVLEQDVDFRSFLTTRETFVNRRLAALYNVPAPTDTGFGSVTLPEEGPRKGYLGHVSFLALQSHSTGTSATLRGMYVRQKFLCQEIPPPPADVDTSIPEADADSPTLRERIQSHLTEPSCATCHNFMDLLGLGFEQFDGIGRYRTTENDALIDPSGALDDKDFIDALDLSEKLAAHDRFSPCMTQQLFQYTTGHAHHDGEEEYLAWLSEQFVESEYSYLALIRTLVLSKAFQKTGEIQ